MKFTSFILMILVRYLLVLGLIATLCLLSRWTIVLKVRDIDIEASSMRDRFSQAPLCIEGVYFGSWLPDPKMKVNYYVWKE